MKIYIVYRLKDYEEPQAIALTYEEAEEMMNTLLSHNHRQTLWIKEKTLTNKAIEI